ncbi:hypothetical protein AAG747_06915 [Rapidithrix thailandica]|uniref:Uncharacterized protein n=1 Tax=Rapidithrix thailandica TaxID=413964 RepID=A0AAW9RX24_9BACT
MQPKNYISLLIILTPILYHFFYRPDYGIVYNEERLKKGMVLIPSGWTSGRTNGYEIQFWEPVEPDTTKAYHKFKKVACSMRQIDYEYDYFVVEKRKCEVILSYVVEYEDEKGKSPWIVQLIEGDGKEIASIETISIEKGLKILREHGLYPLRPSK